MDHGKFFFKYKKADNHKGPKSRLYGDEPLFSVQTVEGQPLRGISSVDSHPFIKAAYHLRIVELPKTSSFAIFNILTVSEYDFFKRQQEHIAQRCSALISILTQENNRYPHNTLSYTTRVPHSFHVE